MTHIGTRPEDREWVSRLENLEKRVRTLESEAHATFGMLTSICAQVEVRVKAMELQQFHGIQLSPDRKRHWWNR